MNQTLLESFLKELKHYRKMCSNCRMLSRFFFVNDRIFCFGLTTEPVKYEADILRYCDIQIFKNENEKPKVRIEVTEYHPLEAIFVLQGLTTLLSDIFSNIHTKELEKFVEKFKNEEAKKNKKSLS